MVNLGLSNSDLVCGRNEELAIADLPIRSDAGLLFPGTGSLELGELLPADRPGQLVVLDGTWHQAKTLLRDLPVLQSLPRYKIARSQPGQFRIRYEPTAFSLSTVEAVVEALQVLEPETDGLKRLLDCFDTMVESQLAHPQAEYLGLPFHLRHRSNLNLPYRLRGILQKVVVASGESSVGVGASSSKRSNLQTNRQPVFWAAERLDDGQSFALPIKTSGELPDRHFEHMQLSRNHWNAAVTVPEFRRAWNEFLKPDDCLVVYNRAAVNLLHAVNASVPETFFLKSINTPVLESPQWIDGDLPRVVSDRLSIKLPGRPGIRLARLVGVVRYLNTIANLESGRGT